MAPTAPKLFSLLMTQWEGPAPFFSANPRSGPRIFKSFFCYLRVGCGNQEVAGFIGLGGVWACEQANLKLIMQVLSRRLVAGSSSTKQARGMQKFHRENVQERSISCHLSCMILRDEMQSTTHSSLCHGTVNHFVTC